jgi:hypothetical protein
LNGLCLTRGKNPINNLLIEQHRFIARLKHCGFMPGVVKNTLVVKSDIDREIVPAFSLWKG